MTSSRHACTTTCYVDAVNGSDLIRRRNDQQHASKTHSDRHRHGSHQQHDPRAAGTYSETAANRLHVQRHRPLPVRPVLPSQQAGSQRDRRGWCDNPITSFSGALATINTNATNNFGPSGIFIEGDNITLQGLRIGTNTRRQNKTIEVIGDGFTLKNSDIADPDGSIYINDFRFDSGSNTSHVKS